MQQYFKIGEISKLYHIGPDSLRYYEELGILTPKRGPSGYRLYSFQDLWRLNVIRDLRSLDFSMERIKDYLDNRSIQATTALLKEELSVIEKKLKELQELQDNVTDRIRTLEESKRQKIGVVEEKTFAGRYCHMIHSGYKTDEEMDMLIKQLLNKDQNNLYIIGNNRIGSRILPESILKKQYRNYDSVFIIDQRGPHLIEAGQYLSICYHGDCNQNERYIPQLLSYAKEHHLTPVGPVYELLWIDIHQAADPREHITELQLRYDVGDGEKGEKKSNRQ